VFRDVEVRPNSQMKKIIVHDDSDENFERIKSNSNDSIQASSSNDSDDEKNLVNEIFSEKKIIDEYDLNEKKIEEKKEKLNNATLIIIEPQQDFYSHCNGSFCSKNDFFAQQDENAAYNLSEFIIKNVQKIDNIIVLLDNHQVFFFLYVYIRKSYMLLYL
jgi:hypothetical protein